MVSIALAVYNGEKFLKKQLESLINQTVKVDEIIIVDDCSTDNSQTIIKDFISKNKEINIVFQKNNINLGYKTTFYNAISICQEDYFFLCDQDDIWVNDKIEKMLDIMKTKTNIKVLGSKSNFIDENDLWWRKGFTEWVNVKKAKPLFEGHYQPRVPLNHNYYNLLNEEVLEWQSKIALEHGITGFCFYHYWFNGKMLLEKPMELFLKNKNAKIDYCTSWANESWTNVWVSSSNKLLMEQTYGSKKEWKEHFDYLLPFFNDERYIKDDNKPLFIIYRPDIMECYQEMIEYWNDLAKEQGFNGIKFVYQHPSFDQTDQIKDCFDYKIEYQPASAIYWTSNNNLAFKLKLQNLIVKYLKINVARKKKLQIFDYDSRWETIVSHRPDTIDSKPKAVPRAFVDWDNTPRRGNTGSLYADSNSQKFKKYFKLQVKKCVENYKQDKIFIFAWNEWAEGGYLEPDEKFGYAYLEAIRDVLIEMGQLETRG